MDIFVFISTIISLLTTALMIYLLCQHKKIRMLITSLILHQVKEVGAASLGTNSECTTLAYIGIILTILSLIIVTFLHYRKSNFCKGHRFSSTVKIMMFISDVPIKLCKTAGSIHLFKIVDTLKARNIKLIKNYLWNTLEIDWKEVTVTFSGDKTDVPRVVIIKLQDKIKMRQLMNRETFAFPSNVKARNNVVHFGNRKTRDCVNTKFQIYFKNFIFLDGTHPTTQMQFPTWIL